MLPVTDYLTFQDGEIIFEEGSTDDALYVVDYGSVELSKMVKGRKVVIESLQPGYIFGEMAFLARIPRTATAQAVGETSVGIIDRAFLDAEYSKLSEHFQTIITTLALRLQKATDALMNTRTDS
ncbi:MAG TPA: cyclic nucleotide-binding domain-containing protein [Syntrophales bacterium]|nr:cyclic nucleotide-binding domain-containing protein [Syntrophales bacterium]